MRPCLSPFPLPSTGSTPPSQSSETSPGNISALSCVCFTAGRQTAQEARARKAPGLRSEDRYHEKIRCALYDRVSTELQVRDGLSLDAQRRALTDYANTHGYEIVDYYSDEGITAPKKDAEPQRASAAS